MAVSFASAFSGACTAMDGCNSSFAPFFVSSAFSPFSKDLSVERCSEVVCKSCNRLIFGFFDSGECNESFDADGNCGR